MTKLLNKSLIAAFSFLFLMAISPISSAGENPFGMSNMAADQVQMSGKDGKCGEGKCGDSKKSAKCGDSKKKSKCGEGKCGDSKKSGKCGDSGKKGKCGDSKKSGKCGGSDKEDNDDKSDD